jgi:hypothetical protein
MHGLAKGNVGILQFDIDFQKLPADLMVTNGYRWLVDVTKVTHADQCFTDGE